MSRPRFLTHWRDRLRFSVTRLFAVKLHPRLTLRWMMVAVAIAAIATWVLLVRPRTFERLAEYHELQQLDAAYWIPKVYPSQQTLRGEWHSEIAHKYRQAARYPFLPVAPDTPWPSAEDDAESTRRRIKTYDHTNWERFFTQQADEKIGPGEWSSSHTPPPVATPEEVRLYRELAKYHGVLRVKYERAALTPRVPLEPDPPKPK